MQNHNSEISSPPPKNPSSNPRISKGWAAAMRLYSDPALYLSERPVMYHGGDVLSETKPLQIQASAKQDITSNKVDK